MKLKIAVVGAGGVGGYIAGKLAKANLTKLQLIARGKNLKAINQNSLTIIEPDCKFNVTINTKDPQNEIFDVVFIATKSYDFKSACESINNFIDEESIIISLANGVDHKKELSSYLHTGKICNGCVYVVSSLKEYGIIEKKSPLFYLIFGTQKPTLKMQKLVEVLNNSGLKSKLSEKVDYDCWKKYLLISSFATMTSYYNESMNVVYKNYYDIVIKILDEIKSVANSMNIPINDKDILKVMKQVKNLPPNSKTSMQHDFEAGKKTELESLSGYIVKKAKENSIKTPILKMMYEDLKQRC
jgi:2-dehydropantoate 2-reductase